MVAAPCADCAPIEVMPVEPNNFVSGTIEINSDSNQSDQSDQCVWSYKISTDQSHDITLLDSIGTDINCTYKIDDGMYSFSMTH